MSASEEVGSVGEEAARLIGALAGWAREHGVDAPRSSGAPADADHPAHDHPEHDHPEHDHPEHDRAGHRADEHGGAPCTACPLCRGMHVLRSSGPEVRAHLAVAASALMQAAASLMAAASEAPSGPSEAPSGAARDGGARVQPIDLDADADAGPDGPQQPDHDRDAPGDDQHREAR